MTVALCDPTVFIVGPKLGSLISTDLPTTIDCGLFGIMVTCGTASPTPFDIPASIWIGNDVMAVWPTFFGHRVFLH